MVKRHSIAKKYGYLWVTLILFSGSIIGHWYYGFQTGNTLGENLRDTFENWQSEFLQLIWQVGGLTYLWYIGSPQSKEEEERNKVKLNNTYFLGYFSSISFRNSSDFCGSNFLMIHCNIS